MYTQCNRALGTGPPASTSLPINHDGCASAWSGQERVLVEDRRPHGRGDAQPGVAHFGRDDEKESERDATKGGGSFGPGPDPPRHHGQSCEHDHRPVAERQHATTENALRGESDIERGSHRQRQDPASVGQPDDGHAESHPTHRRRLRSGDVVAYQAVQRTLETGDARSDL